MAVIAVADMVAISSRRGELAALLQSAEREAAAQPGCRRYTFAATLLDPDRFVLISEWDSQLSFDAHYRSDAFAAFQFALYGLLARPSEMTIHSINESVRLTNAMPMDPRNAD